MATYQQVQKAIEFLGEELVKVYGTDIDWTNRFRTGDDSAILEITERACRRAQINVEDYESVLNTEPKLLASLNQIIVDMMLAPLNPGPDNPSARESAGARVPADSGGMKHED